jgi:hypothetical protein
MHELGAAQRPVLGEREQRRRDGNGRVNDRAKVGVVEVEHVRRHRIHARSRERIESLTAAEERCLWAAREIAKRCHQALDRLIAAARNCTAEPVDHRTRCFMPHRLRHAAPA